MDVVRLRTMTVKSRLAGGKHAGQLVGTILEVHPEHLIYTYYKYKRLSFVNEILDQLGITEELRIEKPGTDMHMRRKFYKDRIRSMDEDELEAHFKMLAKKRKKEFALRRMKQINDENQVCSKASLQRLNQGKSSIDLDPNRS